ncbi:hypothetical protein Tco_0282937 [Tanacetum coccineum]
MKKELDSSKSEVRKEEKVKEEVQKESSEEIVPERENLVLGKTPDEEKEVDYEILDRKYPIKEWKTEEDLNAVYQLVMDKYQDEIPEGFDRVLWGDLMVMFNPYDENEFWNSQQDWNIVSWKLHGSSGVHTLVTEEGLVIHMLVEKKDSLRRNVLMQMLKLKLESEEDSTMALELIRFIKKILAELEPEE